MKRIKKFLKPARKFFHRYVNGTKGVISIFLALVMSPLLSVSLLLVESARYQSAVQMVEELMDCAGFSTLAEYDSYLDKRFGLMAVSQDVNIEQTFSNYMTTNMETAGQSVTLDYVSACGVYPLSDAEIFKQQIQEQSEYSVPIKLGLEGFNVRDRLKVLEENFAKAKGVDTQVKQVKTAADAAKYTKDAVEALGKTVDAVKKVQEAYDAYKLAYDAPNTDADFLGAVNSIRSCAEAHDEAVESYDDTTIYYYDGYDWNTLRTNLSNSWWNMSNIYKPEYVNKATDLKNALQDLKTSITGPNGCIQKLEDAIEKCKKFDEATNGAGLGKVLSAVVSKLESAKTAINIYLTGTIDAGLDVTIADLESQITSLNNMTETDFTPGSGSINANWNDNTINATAYPPINVAGEILTIDVSLGAIIAELNSLANDSSSADSIKDSMKVFDSLKELNFLYDSTLDSTVSADSLYMDTMLSFADTVAITALGTLVQGINDVAESFTCGDLVKLVKGVIEVVVGFVEFVAAMVAWIGQLIWNVGCLLAEIGESVVAAITSGSDEGWDKVLLYGYAAYNFPNRTTYDYVKGVSLSGETKYRDIAAMAGASITTPTLTGRLMDLADLITDENGSDTMFVGAEQEYLFAGSKSEIANQTLVVFNLYMLRLVLDFCSIWFSTKETKAYLEVPVAGVILFIITILIEPMIDVFLLVNPGKDGNPAEIPFYKTEYVYFSVTGLPHLLNKLDEMSSGLEVKGDLADSIKSGLSSRVGKAKGDTGKIDSAVATKDEKSYQCNYTEHLLVLTLISVQTDTLVRRMQNIVSMEGKGKYGTEFDLTKTYTYVYGCVEYTLNPMFNLDSLTNQGLFKGKKTRYAGY